MFIKFRQFYSSVSPSQLDQINKARKTNLSTEIVYWESEQLFL